MTPELWQAKRVVDSTLHPGAYKIDPAEHVDSFLSSYRHRRSRVFALSHVVLRTIESSCHRGHAHSRFTSKVT